MATSLDIRTPHRHGTRAQHPGPLNQRRLQRARISDAARHPRVRAARRPITRVAARLSVGAAMTGNVCLNSANECGKTVFLRPAPQRFAGECRGSLA